MYKKDSSMNQFIDKLFTFSLIFFDSYAGERIGLHIGFRNEMWKKYEKAKGGGYGKWFYFVDSVALGLLVWLHGVNTDSNNTVDCCFTHFCLCCKK